MKKILLIFAFLLVGCSSSPEPGDTSSIAIGMNEDRVIDILGEPDQRTTDRNELTGEYESLTSLYAVGAEFDDDKDEDVIYGRNNEIHTAIEEQENVEVFEYEPEDNYLIIVYFINNEVSHFYELDLNED